MSKRPQHDLNLDKETIEDARSAFWKAETSGDTYETEWQGKTITIHKGSMMDRVIKEDRRLHWRRRLFDKIFSRKR